MDVKSTIGFILIFIISTVYFIMYSAFDLNSLNDSMGKSENNPEALKSTESTDEKNQMSGNENIEQSVNTLMKPLNDRKKSLQKIEGFWVETNIYRMRFSLKDAGIKQLLLKDYLDKEQRQINAIFHPDSNPSGLSTHFASAFNTHKQKLNPLYQYAVYTAEAKKQNATIQFNLALSDDGNMKKGNLVKTENFVKKVLSKMQDRFKTESFYAGPFKMVAFYTELNTSNQGDKERRVGLLKLFSFREDNYFIDLDFQIMNLSSDEFIFQSNRDKSASDASLYIYWGRSLGPSPKMDKTGLTYKKTAYDILNVSYLNAELNDLEELKSNKKDLNNFQWLGMDSRYLSAFLIQDWSLNKIGEKVWNRQLLDGEVNLGKFVPSKWLFIFDSQARADKDQEVMSIRFPVFSLYPKEIKEFHLGALIGPKTRFFLNQEGLDGFNFSYIRDRSWVPFIKPLEWFIEWLIFILYRWIPNFGVVIVLLAVILKILLYPLSRKTIQSTRKLQKLAPQIKEIEKKYANQQQKKQILIMELYKREKVNPLGGCLPLILQLPVFFAMWQVLPSLIELKNVNFLWIRDLSAPDTVMQINLYVTNQLNILPLIMVATSFIQMKFMPSQAQTGEAAQRAKTMQMVLPIVLLFVFWSMPSGMVLYWTVQNILQILQEIYARLNWSKKNNHK